MNKQNCGVPYNGTLLNNGKKQTTETYNYTDESQKHLISEKMSHTKDNKLYDSFVWNFRGRN